MPQQPTPKHGNYQSISSASNATIPDFMPMSMDERRESASRLFKQGPAGIAIFNEAMQAAATYMASHKPPTYNDLGVPPGHIVTFEEKNALRGFWSLSPLSNSLGKVDDFLTLSGPEDTGGKPLNLTGVDLRLANMVGKWDGANLTSARMEGVSIGPTSTFKNTNFTGAHMEGIQIVSLRATDGIILYSQTPPQDEVRHTPFKGANFTNSHLAGAQIEKANFEGCKFTGADFTKASLDDVSFRDAKLRGANLTSVTFAHQRSGPSSVPNLDFQGADLVDANLNKGNFQGASFAYAWLERTNVGMADFKGANFDHANIKDIQNLSQEQAAGIKNLPTTLAPAAINKPRTQMHAP
jgi:uncharacterized protein YjbI with pentapeptide repeats